VDKRLARTGVWSQLAGWDVLIIAGGLLVGFCGMRLVVCQVLLVEADDFASGTSARFQVWSWWATVLKRPVRVT